MSKKDEFKAFARLHPELVSSVKSGEMSWQKFYEIYDIYGDNNEAWKDYIREVPTNNSSSDFSSSVAGLADKFKNIDMSSVQEHIKTAQKALSLVQELTTKGSEGVTSLNNGPITPRPLNKFFED